MTRLTLRDVSPSPDPECEAMRLARLLADDAQMDALAAHQRERDAERESIRANEAAGERMFLVLAAFFAALCLIVALCRQDATPADAGFDGSTPTMASQGVSRP